MNASIAAGVRIHGYQVVSEIRRGRRLEVYDVWSEERRCRCVAKVLRPESASDASARRRLQREGRLLRTFTHPHIVRAYEVVEVPDPARPGVILETLTGHTLGRLIDDYGALDVEECLLLGMQLCSALGYLHTHGYLHLDLKPCNIVAEAGRAKLIDLSIARRPGRSRTIAGTRGYMASEQARGDAVGEATDVCGLGAVLWEAVAGRPIHEVPADSDSSYAGSGPVEFAAVEQPARGGLWNVPSGFEALVLACLDPRPERRPSLEEVSGTLQALSGTDLRTHGAGLAIGS
ncbi:MAG: serine/threonine-protein kinase [Actinomycetota bacterium]